MREVAYNQLKVEIAQDSTDPEHHQRIDVVTNDASLLLLRQPRQSPEPTTLEFFILWFSFRS